MASRVLTWDCLLMRKVKIMVCPTKLLSANRLGPCLPFELLN